MSRDPLAAIAAAATPQSRPIPGREAEMVRNNAGGHTFAKDLWRTLEDFLVLGTAGGTYYVGEQTHTFQNVQVVNGAVAADGQRAVALAVEVSTGRPPRAPRNHPALFLLATAITNGDLETRRAARTALPQVARTTFHQANFFGYWKALHGKATGNGTAPKTGRVARGALGDLLTSQPPDRVAFQACKAAARKTPQGEPFSLRDVLRIAHPKAESPQRRALFGWIAGNVDDAEARQLLPSVDAFLTAKAVTSAAEAVGVVTGRGVPWEFLPDAVLTEPEVWDALIDTVGMTALIRNLARMTRIGTLTPMGEATRRAAARLTDRDALAAGRIHPLDVYLALRVYASGCSRPNPKAPAQSWTPVPQIKDALEEAFDLSFGHIEPSGKRLLIAVDSSGSMSYGSMTASGSPLGTAYQVACAMATILARIERANAHVIDVDTVVHASRITPRTNLREIDTWRPSGGGTDLSLPFSHALAQRLEVDGVLVLTDNETWAGRIHPSQALASYRSGINPAARCVVASLTAAGHSIADPRDEGVLQIAGFDATLPQVVTGFLR
ncbi:TROVE domain-containing protein [Actinospica durhamensis]|uniref:TROVE domain-containing protein n=1 Tax=Actinospica durhamensis TaxID=1508375 RepID=A0A941ITC0_9ACTN|nr:TROVE domain-containing protein [Actinospica durhamensis]MBR7839564.1 TROVE domain-containing protein [Actinospica durhamensis]